MEEEEEDLEFHDWTLKDIEKFEKSVFTPNSSNNEGISIYKPT